MTDNEEILEAVVEITNALNILTMKHWEQTKRLRGLMQQVNALEDGLNCPDEVS